MFKKKTKKRLLEWLIAFWFINQFSPYIGGFLRTVIIPSKISVKNLDYSKFNNLPNDFNALDYLNLSSSIIHNKNNMGAVCVDFASATYDAYNNLIKINNRHDLASKIRMVAGEIVEEKERNGHVWLEIKLEDNKFYPYETVMPTPTFVSNEAIKKYKRKNLDLTTIFNRYSVTIPGTRFSLPTKDMLNPIKKGFYTMLFSSVNEILKK